MKDFVNLVTFYFLTCIVFSSSYTIHNSTILVRMKREMSKGDQCKAMELSQKSASTVADIAGDIGSIPIIGDVLGIFTAGVSLVTHLTSNGLDIAQTALDCGDIPFDEIKEIMDKRFNEVDRKLDKNTAALEAVSKLVNKTLRAVEQTRSEMHERFNEVIASIENTKIQPIVSKIINFVQYFSSEEERLRGLKKTEYVAKLKEQNNILLYLRESRTPKGDSLHAPLFDIIKQRYAIPDDVNDEISFKALDALIYGTQTYVQVMFFLLEKYTYLANYHYQIGDIDQYNKYFDDIITSFQDFKSSIIGSTALNKDEPLLESVIGVLNEVKDSYFVKRLKKELAQRLKVTIQSFKNITNEIEEMNLPVIEETPENFVQFTFEKDIKTPVGEWQRGKSVRYAVQYESEDTYSKVGEWSQPYQVQEKACPFLTIPVDQRRKNRLVFRKFDNDVPKLVGVIDAYETEFTDINRDLYNAADTPDKQAGLRDAIKLINEGADVNAKFEKGRCALHAAAAHGNHFVAVQLSLKDKSLDFNIKDKDGYTPMHVAANAGQSGFISFLLRHEADVNAKSISQESTPLHIAARRGFHKTVSALLSSSKIDLNQKDKLGFTPLHSAVVGGMRVIDVLVSKENIDINPKSENQLTPFHLTAINNDVDVAKALIKSNKVEVNAADENGMTPLHYAAMIGHVDMVSYLISLSDVNLNAQTKGNNWTPLHYSILFKRDDISKKLLNSGKVDLQLKADGQVSYLHFAVTFEREKVVNELLSKGIDLEEKTKESYTALHLATMSGKKIVQALLDGGASAKAQSNDDQTPLHLAAMNDNLDIVKILVNHDNSVMEVKNNRMETPLQAASRKLNINVVKFLRDSGAAVNVKNMDNLAPLHIFTIAGNTDMVKDLIKNGADVNISDNNGYNFFYYALKEGHLDIVKYAVENEDFMVAPMDGARDVYCPAECKWEFCIVMENDRLSVIRYLLQHYDAKVCLPLHSAAHHGHIDVTKFYVEEKQYAVDGETPDRTPLCVAIEAGNADIANYLADKGADVKVKCEYISSELYAIEKKSLDSLKVLADHGAELKETYSRGNNLLHKAAQAQDLDIVKYLVEIVKIPVNDANDDGQTPLHIAAKFGPVDIVIYLVDKGADKDARDNNGKNPVDIAYYEAEDLDMAGYLGG